MKITKPGYDGTTYEVEYHRKTHSKRIVFYSIGSAILLFLNIVFVLFIFKYLYRGFF